MSITYSLKFNFSKIKYKKNQINEYHEINENFNELNKHLNLFLYPLLACIQLSF